MYRNTAVKEEGGKKKEEAGERSSPLRDVIVSGIPLSLSLSLDRADTFLPGTLCIPLASFAVSFLQEASIFILHNAFVIAACTLYLFRFCNAMKMYEAIAIIRTGMQNFSRAPGLTRCRQVGKESKWTGEWDCRIIKGLSCVWTPPRLLSLAFASSVSSFPPSSPLPIWKCRWIVGGSKREQSIHPSIYARRDYQRVCQRNHP